MPTYLFNRDGRSRTGGGFLLLGAMLFAIPFGLAWTNHTQTQAATSNDGEQIYMMRCMSCHQTDGKGIAGVFPPLDGTEWVKGDKGRLIRIVLQGLTGETTVQDVVYSGAMPPWQSFLNDEEIAAVLTYVRSAWNNDASAVTEQEVAAVRTATEGRTDAWTEEELEEEENLGVPGIMDFLGLPVKADSSGQ